MLAEQKRQSEAMEAEALADAEARAWRQKERETQLTKILEVRCISTRQ